MTLRIIGFQGKVRGTPALHEALYADVFDRVHTPYFGRLESSGFLISEMQGVFTLLDFDAPVAFDGCILALSFQDLLFLGSKLPPLEPRAFDSWFGFYLPLEDARRIIADLASVVRFEVHRMLDENDPGLEAMSWKMQRCSLHREDTELAIEGLKASGYEGWELARDAMLRGKYE